MSRWMVSNMGCLQDSDPYFTDGLVVRLKVRCFVPYLGESDKLLISHHVKFSSKQKPRFQAPPMVEQSAEGPGEDGAMENVPFSPVDLEARQDTPEPNEDVRIQSLRGKALSKTHLMTHIPKTRFVKGAYVLK